MLVSPLNTTTDVKLEVVTHKIKAQLTSTPLQAIDCTDVVIENTVKAPVLEALKPAAVKFTITFSYQQQLHRTKVNVSGTNYGMPIYKVALNSRLSNESNVCWLQNTSDGWVILLGNHLDAKLIKAITSAIEDQQ